MATVLLGNTNPTSDAVDGNAVTQFVTPDGTKRLEAVTSITKAYDEYHSVDPPEWVESDDERLAEDIAEHYTWEADDDREAHTCVVGRPSDWVGRDFTSDEEQS